jgi:hypothetical protein
MLFAISAGCAHPSSRRLSEQPFWDRTKLRRWWQAPAAEILELRPSRSRLFNEL